MNAFSVRHKEENSKKNINHDTLMTEDIVIE